MHVGHGLVLQAHVQAFDRRKTGQGVEGQGFPDDSLAFQSTLPGAAGLARCAHEGDVPAAVGAARQRHQLGRRGRPRIPAFPNLESSQGWNQQFLAFPGFPELLLLLRHQLEADGVGIGELLELGKAGGP